MDAADDEESHGKLVPVSEQSEFQFHLVFSNKTQTDGYCLEVWGKLTAQGVQVWQQQKNIPKDSDNWFNEWYPSAAKSIKIVCFLTTAYLKSPYCMKEFGIAQAKDKLLVVACEPVREITSVDPSKYPHASNALAYLEGGGQVIFHDTDDVVAEIMKFIPRQAAAAAPEPEPASPAAGGGGLGLPPNAASPKPLLAAAAAVGTDVTVASLLASVRLDKYTSAFSTEGYEYLSDLLEADAEEVAGVVEAVGLRKPEARRFHTALASMSGGGGGARGGAAGGGGQEAARLQAEKAAVEKAAAEAIAQEKARAAAQVAVAQQQAAQAEAQRQAAEAQRQAAEAQQRAAAEEASVALARQLQQEEKMKAQVAAAEAKAAAAAAQAAEPEPEPAAAAAEGAVATDEGSLLAAARKEGKVLVARGAEIALTKTLIVYTEEPTGSWFKKEDHHCVERAALTIAAAGGGAKILGPQGKSAVYCYGAALTLQGVAVEARKNSAVVCTQKGRAELSGCTLTSPYAGLWVGSGATATMDGGSVSGCGDTGVYCYESGTATLRGVTLERNKRDYETGAGGKIVADGVEK